MNTKINGQQNRLPIRKVFCLLIILLTNIPTLLKAIQRENNKIVINLYYKQYRPDDSLRLYLSDVLAYNKESKCYFPKENADKSFRFEIEVKEKYGYFNFQVKRRTSAGDMMIVRDQFWEAGDSITVHVSHRETNAGIFSNCEFSGRGAVKYKLWDKMEQIRMVQMEEPKYFLGNILTESLPDMEVTQKQKLIFLEQNKSLIGEVPYGVFKAALFTDALGSNLYYIRDYFEQHIINQNEAIRSAFAKKFRELFLPVNPHQIDDIALAQSKDYIERIDRIFKVYTLIEKGKYDPEFCFQAIVDHTAGFTREAVLMTYFLSTGNSKKVGPLYKKAEQFMLSSDKKTELKNLASRSSKILDDYSFKDLSGKEVKISDFKGKLILIDVYFWGCGGCEVYYRNVLSKLEQEPFIGKEVILLSVSYDRTIDQWKRGLMEGKYTSDKAVNVYAGPALGFKHPFIADNEIVWMPTPMLVDRRGSVVNFKTEDLKTYSGLMMEIKRHL